MYLQSHLVVHLESDRLSEYQSRTGKKVTFFLSLSYDQIYIDMTLWTFFNQISHCQLLLVGVLELPDLPSRFSAIKFQF